MSQFSASYHLVTSNQQDVADLLNRANLHGYIFPEKEGIVTFVIRQDEMSEFACCQQLLAQNKEPLVFFMNAEDHGWLYEIYDQSECVARYSSSYNEAGIMEEFYDEDSELFAPGEDINDYFIYEGSFEMERVKELLKHSIAFHKKIAVIQKSKFNVDAQKGLAKEGALNLEEEALTADEFAEEFGIFFYEWISYHYIELDLKENIFDYGSLGQFPLKEI